MDICSITYLRRLYFSSILVCLISLFTLYVYTTTIPRTKPPDRDSLIYKHLINRGFKDKQLLHNVPLPNYLHYGQIIGIAILLLQFVIVVYLEILYAIAYFIGPKCEVLRLLDRTCNLLTGTHMFYFDTQDVTFTNDSVIRHGNVVLRGWCDRCHTYGHNCNTNSFGYENNGAQLSAEFSVLNFITDSIAKPLSPQPSAHSIRLYNDLDKNIPRYQTTRPKATLIAIVPDTLDMSPYVGVSCSGTKFWINLYPSLSHLILIKANDLDTWYKNITAAIKQKYFDVTVYGDFIPNDARIIDTVTSSCFPDHNRIVDESLWNLFERVKSGKTFKNYSFPVTSKTSATRFALDRTILPPLSFVGAILKIFGFGNEQQPIEPESDSDESSDMTNSTYPASSSCDKSYSVQT